MSFRHVHPPPASSGHGAAAGTFGLSPRVSSNVQRGQSSAFPRASPSPMADGSQAMHAFPSPATAAAQFAAPGSHSRRGSHDRHDGFDKRSFEDGGSSFAHSSSISSRDHAELSVWQRQQQMLEAQAQSNRRMKYGLCATLSMLLLLVLYFINQQPSTPSYKSSDFGGGNRVLHAAAQYHEQQLLSSYDPPSYGLGDELGVGAGVAPDDGYIVEYDASRRMLEEFTQREMERERRELFEFDPEAEAARPKPLEDISKLNPAERATVVVPAPHTPGEHDGPDHDHSMDHERGHEYARAHASASMASARLAGLDGHVDETPDMLRRLAEEQRMTQLEQERAALEALGGRRNARLHEGEDELPPSDGQRAPSYPAPTQGTHVVIEQLLHEHTKEGDEVKAHSHKDHPGVPKFGNGPQPIPMPADPKKPKTAPAAATPTTAPAASTDAAASSAAHGRKKASGASETVDLDVTADEVKPASTSDEDLLSALSSAANPGAVASDSDAAASALNKKTGLKGPVLRGANADAQEGADSAAAAAATTPTATKSKSKASKSKKKKKPKKVSAIATDDDEEESDSGVDLKAAAKKWAELKTLTLGDHVEYPVVADPSAVAEGEENYIFDDDVQVIVFTNLKAQALARKVKSLYTPLVKRLTFVSDGRDNGLNATVFQNPHPDWEVRKNPLDLHWRLYELISAIASGQVGKASFYLVMHDSTFPLLDQIRWKLDEYREIFGEDNYPAFTGGRKQAFTFEHTYWKEQQEQGEAAFKGKKMFAVPAYMYGFDHGFVQSVSELIAADSCPLLSTEGGTLAALLDCAATAEGKTQIDQLEWDFLAQTRSNHREKKIHKTAAPLSEWRQFDAFNGCNTPGMLQEAYDGYYGKLKKE